MTGFRSIELLRVSTHLAIPVHLRTAFTALLLALHNAWQERRDDDRVGLALDLIEELMFAPQVGPADAVPPSLAPRRPALRGTYSRAHGPAPRRTAAARRRTLRVCVSPPSGYDQSTVAGAPTAPKPARGPDRPRLCAPARTVRPRSPRHGTPGRGLGKPPGSTRCLTA